MKKTTNLDQSQKAWSWLHPTQVRQAVCRSDVHENTDAIIVKQHVTQPSAPEDVTEFCCYEGFKMYIYLVLLETSSHFACGKICSGRIRGWADPRTMLETSDKSKICCPARNWTRSPWSSNPCPIHYINLAISAPYWISSNMNWNYKQEMEASVYNTSTRMADNHTASLYNILKHKIYKQLIYKRSLA